MDEKYLIEVAKDWANNWSDIDCNYYVHVNYPFWDKSIKKFDYNKAKIDVLENGKTDFTFYITNGYVDITNNIVKTQYLNLIYRMMFFEDKKINIDYIKK